MTQRANHFLIEVSTGELLDRITILQIKKERIAEPAKLANVCAELAALEALWDGAPGPLKEVRAAVAELRTVNETLWDVEEEIRLCERRGDFGPRFIELARSVYHQNDRRAVLKRRLNELCASRLVEEKSYPDYRREGTQV